MAENIWEDLKIDDDTLIKYTGSSANVVIPDIITRIGDGAFNNRAELISVTIPEGVTSIGKKAFCNCIALTNITLPEGVTSIGNEAFYCCTGLSCVTLPSSVTHIGDGAFAVCVSLKSVKFAGTQAQWKAIAKSENWNSNAGDFTVCCADGDI